MKFKDLVAESMKGFDIWSCWEMVSIHLWFSEIPLPDVVSFLRIRPHGNEIYVEVTTKQILKDKE